MRFKRIDNQFRSRFNARRLILLLAVLLVLAVVLFLRGPYISNLLKMAILSEVQDATGRQIIAQHIYINALPLFVEARGVKAFDEEGARVFEAERIKGYLSLSSILKRKIDIQRLVLVKPVLWADRSQIGGILENLRNSGEKKEKLFSLDVGVVVLKEGEISFYEEKQNAVHDARGIDAEIVIKEKPELMFSVSEITSTVREWPALKWGMNGTVVLTKDFLVVRRLDINSGGSSLKARGPYFKDGRGDFTVDLSLLVENVKNLLALESPGKGVVSASGSVKLSREWKDTLINLEMNGDFNLETLMEVLNVPPRHDLKGYVKFDGGLKGSLSDLQGTADAGIEKGSFFDVKLERGRFRVDYKSGALRIKDEYAHLYGGNAKVDVTLGIPEVWPYSVSVRFSDVDSASALGLIHLATIGLAEGRAWGELRSSGMDFNPEGWFEYKSSGEADKPVGRIREAKGIFNSQDDVVRISRLEANTANSMLSLKGYLDRKSSAVSFSFLLATGDVSDVLSPYFRRLNGNGEFEGTISGTAEDPLVEGKIELSDAFLDDYPLGVVEAEVSYRKELLMMPYASAREGDKRYDAKGSVEFASARKVLDIKSPRYFIDVTLAGADLNRALKIAGHDVPLHGEMDSEFTIRGAGAAPVFSGKASLSDAEVYGRHVSSASSYFSYGQEGLKISNAVLTEGGDTLRLDGSLERNGSFAFDASSEGLSLRSVSGYDLPFEYRMSVKASGQGTLKHPEINLSAELSDGRFKGSRIGGGSIKAHLKGKELEVESSLLNDKAYVKALAELEDDLPWSARVDVKQGRFDFLLAPFFKKVPDDLMLNVTGSADIKGNKEHLYSSVRIQRLNLNMFRQGFSNESDIVVSVKDKELSMDDFTLRSGNASLDVGGSIRINSYYDLRFEGRSSLSPLRGFSERIDELRGDARFVFAIQGEWDDPIINGGMTVSDGSFAVGGFPQRFTAVEGYVYVEKERMVIEGLNGKLGGGDIGISGILLLSGFGLEQVYLDMTAKDVTVSVSNKFNVNVGGNFLFRAKDDIRDFTGDFWVNRASYRERTEWKSWLVAARKIALPKAEDGWADTVRLNVKLSGSKRIMIDNNIARAPMKIEMLLKGTLGRPLLLGRVESTEGKMFFRNSEFTISSATADFLESRPNEPFVLMNAETSIKGYDILLNLEGHLDQFDLALASDPPLDEVEILGLLTLGEFGEDLSSIEGGIGAAEATSFITGGFQDVVEERFKDLTGVDRFQIDPYVSKSTGTVTPRVTVSKRLISDKLFVTYAAAMGSAEEQELKMEYVIGENISLIGGRDDLGTLGGDIKFRFKFK
jgi:translocation and assembly module TamB